MNGEIEPREGALFTRLLPDGRELTVYPMLFNDRIVIGPPGEPWYDEAWCYVKGTAVEVARDWDGEEPPPGDWIKKVGTDLRGPGLRIL